MKKILSIFALACILSACSKTNSWEYKIVRVTGQDTETRADFSPKVFADQSNMLNQLGKEGWELVDIYEETSTQFCNFGHEEYVMGIQPNVRTAIINFVFKRPSASNNKKETNR